MKYTLVKHFWISCAHFVADAGKCASLHGHNYKVVFCIKGSKLDELDMLIDFRDIKRTIKEKFDHQNLNEFPEFNEEMGGVRPTTERVAEVFYHTIESLCAMKNNQPKVAWVEVHETNEAYARYE